MNRNYKVIWNASLNCFMAVAEYTKSRGKSSKSSVRANASINSIANLSSTRPLRLSAIGLGLLAAGFGIQANADLCIESASVECGTSATASGYYSIAIGNNAKAVGSQTIAIGSTVYADRKTTALGDQSIAIGADVISKGASSIAIGGDDLNDVSETNTDGSSSNILNGGTVNTTFKYYAKRDLVEPDKYTIYTESSGAASIAIGTKSLSQGDLSTAVGTHSSTDGIAASAFGVAASATKDGSVALGAGSLTDQNTTSVKKMAVGGLDYDIAGNVLDASNQLKTGAQVSVGSAGFERQIKNVAGGEVSTTSTDAINGSQLAATNSAVNNNSTTIAQGIKLGINGVQKTYALGEEIKLSTDENITTTSFENDTKFGLANTISVGTEKPVSINGTAGTITGLTNTTFDKDAAYSGGQAATQEQLLQINNDINQTVDQGLNFTGDNTAITVNRKLSQKLTIKGGEASADKLAAGNNIGVIADDTNDSLTVKLAKDLTGLNSAAFGTDVNISSNGLRVGNSTVNSDGFTFLSTDSLSNTVGLSNTGLNNGGNVITNVAEGTIATDAVNFGQLSALDKRLDDNINELGYKIGDVEDNANAGISAAMAMSSLPQAYIPGKSLISGGIGTYNGESAFAIGFSKLSNDGRWVIKVNGAADTEGNTGGAIGAGFHFD